MSPLLIILLGLVILLKLIDFNLILSSGDLVNKIFKSTYFWAILGYAAWIFLIGLYEPRFSWGFSLFLILFIWKKVFEVYDSRDKFLNIGLPLIGAAWFASWAIFTGPFY
jgi:hypothetical protein